jgi:hypothetical protein
VACRRTADVHVGKGLERSASADGADRGPHAPRRPDEGDGLAFADGDLYVIVSGCTGSGKTTSNH